MAQWRVLYDFAAEEDGELSVRAGDIVRALDDLSAEKDGWMLVEVISTGASGFIPTEYATPADSGAAAADTAPAAAPRSVDAPAPAAQPATPAASEAALHASLRSLLTPGGAGSPPGGGPAAAAASSAGASRSTLAPVGAGEDPSFAAAVPALGGTAAALGAASLLPPVPAPSGGPTLEDVGRYFAAHEEWYRTATLKRQETYRALQGDCVELLRTLAEGEGRSAGLLGRIGELEALIADERSRWSQKLAEDAAVAK